MTCMVIQITPAVSSSLCRGACCGSFFLPYGNRGFCSLYLENYVFPGYRLDTFLLNLNLQTDSAVLDNNIENARRGDPVTVEISDLSPDQNSFLLLRKPDRTGQKMSGGKIFF